MIKAFIQKTSIHLEAITRASGVAVNACDFSVCARVFLTCARNFCASARDFLICARVYLT